MGCGLIHYNQPDLNSFDAFLEFAADTGFVAVELLLSDYWPEGSDHPESVAAHVRDKLDSFGLEVCAVSASNDFIQRDAVAIEREVERMERVCGLAKILGTSVVRTEGGCPKEGVSEGRYFDRIVESLKRCRDFIEREGITLALDNHGPITNSADFQIKIIEAVDSPFVTAAMDTMNYRWAGHDLETVSRFYEMLAPYVRHVHIKDGTGVGDKYEGKVLGEGEIDICKAINTLKETGYKGVWCIEYEGEEGSIGYAKCLQYLRELLSDG